MEPGPIFELLRFRDLTIKTRILRSNIAGRFDVYGGTGSQARRLLTLLRNRTGREVIEGL